MRIWRVWMIGACIAAAGCVHGYGGCLWVTPVKHTLTGRVHYRSFPTSDGGEDNVPVLQLDRMAYIYAPAQSLLCQAADEMQLDGISEFSESVVEGSRVSVTGKINSGVATHDHTPFVLHVITLFPDRQPPPAG
jgi:hypothetical protein